jgi:hypothetical protein
MKQYQVVDGTSYDARTPKDLVLLLEKIRANHQRIRLFYGDPKTGKVWDEAFPERGTLGRSMGSIKIPLLIKTARSWGGEAILDHCIIRVEESTGGKILWQHARFNG